MVKIVSFLISVLVLMQSMNLHFEDLVELDSLVEHYQFHNEEHGDNLFLFVSKHYGKLKTVHDQEQQEGQDDHENLPFQHAGHSLQIMVFVMSPNTYPYSFAEVPSSHNNNFHYHLSYSLDLEDGLFQPPKHS